MPRVTVSPKAKVNKNDNRETTFKINMIADRKRMVYNPRNLRASDDVNVVYLTFKASK